MEFISGKSREQTMLLPESIDEYVDENSTVRVIDAYIDGLDMAALGFTRAQPNETGRPMYSSKDLLKLYVYGYMNRVRSSRRLEMETKRNLEVIWLLGKLSPDHKTIARFRQDNGDALKRVFRDFVKVCMKLGLYGKELVAIDGSKFRAVNNKDRNFNERKLKERIARIDVKIGEYLRLLKESDAQEEGVAGEKTSEEIAEIVAALRDRKDSYEAMEEELKETGQRQKSLTDADSRLMLLNGKMDVCYNVQAAVDSKHKMVVEFEVTNKVADKNLLSAMAMRAAEALDSKELTVVADTGYESASDIAKCLREGIQAHVAGMEMEICLPVDAPPNEPITGHENGRTVYIPERNIAICPMGNVLYPQRYKKKTRKGIFYNRAACLTCPCKCMTSEHHKFEIQMPESAFTKAYDDHNLSVEQVRVKADKDIVRARKAIVEHPFGTLKRSMESGYCLTRGLRNVNGEFSLSFLAYTVKRAINILGVPTLMRYLWQERLSRTPC